MPAPAIRRATRGDRREPDCIMATVADVRRIALSLPGTVEATTDFAFAVMVAGEAKRFAWCWNERVNPKKPRVPNLSVLGLIVANLVDKDFMMSDDPEKFVTDAHYNGYAAVLVRLPKVRVPELRQLMTEAHRLRSTPVRPKRRKR
jgi:hypothetical protein